MLLKGFPFATTYLCEAKFFFPHTSIKTAYRNRLDAEADRGIQLSLIKPGSKEIFENKVTFQKCKIVPLFSLFFFVCFGKYSSALFCFQRFDVRGLFFFFFTLF